MKDNKIKKITLEEVIEGLELTIKRDEMNKLVAFLCMLSIYTEDSQFNLSFNAPSSTGKSYIPMEVSALFPKEDVLTLAYSSPTAFFHGTGKWDEERKVRVIDLSSKIIIFQDQPHTDLLQRLRPLLSHDEKVLRVQIADKKQRAGLRTKEIELVGFPSVIFCSANMQLDEQEGTRFILLSPEISQEKIREAVYSKIEKESDRKRYEEDLESNPKRILLKERVLVIKESGIKDVSIKDYKDLISKKFWETRTTAKPRHSRDIGRVMSLIKSIALLNFQDRIRIGDVIEAKEEDIIDAFRVWNSVSESQEHNLPPFTYQFYKNIIVDGFLKQKDKIGLSRRDIQQKYYTDTKQWFDMYKFRTEILPLLLSAGLVEEIQDKNDGRILRYIPKELPQNNSVESGRVTI